MIASQTVSRKTRGTKTKSPDLPTSADCVAGIVAAGTPVERVPLSAIAVLPGNPEPDPDVVAEIVAHGIDEPVILVESELVDFGNSHMACADPPSPYILLAGATRLAAAQQRGEDVIDARVRRKPISLADAIAFALRSNTGRRLVTTAETAGRVQQLAACGLSDQEIAAQTGLPRDEINQLRRLCSLPRVWQERVTRFERTRGLDEDSLSWSAAKALLPYVDVPAVVEQLEKDWSSEWNRVGMSTREGFRESVQDTVAAHSRPVLAGETFYDSATHQVRTVPKKQLDPLTTQELVIRDVQINGKKQPRAFCDLKTYDQVFPPPKSNGKLHGGSFLDDDQAARPTSPPALTAAELRAKEKADDEELAVKCQRNGGLREIGLRLACRASTALRPGSAASRNVARWLAVCARDSDGANDLDPSTWITDAALIWADKQNVSLPKLPARKGWARPSKEQYAEFWAAFATLEDSLDAHDRVEVEFIKLVLWPQTDRVQARHLYPCEQWPDRFPAIPSELLPAICAELQATMEQAWTLARDSDSAAGRWFRKVLESHDRRQLTALARNEMSFSAGSCRSIEAFSAAKKGEQIAILTEAHAAANLRIPKLLTKACKR